MADQDTMLSKVRALLAKAEATGPHPAVTPGHPEGCCCGECDVRRRHSEGAPGHYRCEPHGLCLGCDGCTPCEMDAQRDFEITGLIRDFPEQVRRAERAVNDVRHVVARLLDLADIELEGANGQDALGDLDAILRKLRNVKRIADARFAVEED